MALAALVLGVGSGHPALGAKAIVCNGIERWDVKTLADAGAADVKLAPSQIKHISVKTLRMKRKPANAPEGRIAPVETTVYEVEAALVKARWVWDPSPGTPTKKRGDRDIHLVIAAPSDHDLQMIVEFPDPACVAAQPALRKMMRDARNAFLACKGLMPSSNKPFRAQRGRLLRPTARDRACALRDRAAPGAVLLQLGLPAGEPPRLTIEHVSLATRRDSCLRETTESRRSVPRPRA